MTLKGFHGNPESDYLFLFEISIFGWRENWLFFHLWHWKVSTVILTAKIGSQKHFLPFLADSLECIFSITNACNPLYLQKLHIFGLNWPNPPVVVRRMHNNIWCNFHVKGSGYNNPTPFWPLTTEAFLKIFQSWIFLTAH